MLMISLFLVRHGIRLSYLGPEPQRRTAWPRRCATTGRTC